MNLTRKSIFTIFFLIQFSSFCYSQQSTPENSFSFIQKQFLQPGKEYRSAPLWVWNAQVTHELIDTMLTEFKDKGFGAVFVHPRPGLITPYLSSEWFELWKYSMQKAKQLDMDIWIYDENSYPSGFAGGHVPNEMPESFNQAQMLRMKKTDRIPADSSEYFIALEKLANDSFRKIPAGTKTTVPGEYYLFTKAFYYTSPWYGGFSYVDLMVPGVTEKFLDVTMRKGYELIAADEFGRSVKGIFSDEPNIEVWDTISVRWTPLLFPLFKKKWNYNLEHNLPSLFEETGDWKKVRYNYFSVLHDLFIEYWAKPMYQYTNEKKLEWTGHYWEHEWPGALHVPDNMALYAWHQRPGIDMLFNQFDEYSHTAQFGNIRSVKELSSVANQLGKKRTLSETYGGGGWELSFKDMKRLGDWEFVLGVNTLNQHLSYMTMQGARKYDYPQSFSYHNPWWPYYKDLNLHFARLSLALSTGKQKNEVLIIEPTTTAWMYYNYRTAHKQLERTGQSFQSFITRLEKAQVEYDLGSENIIKDHGDIRGTQFVIGDASYKTVVIPPGTENISEELFILLSKFKKQGGQVLLFDTIQYIGGKKDKRLDQLTVSCIRFNGLAALDNNIITKYFLNSVIRFPVADTTKGKLYHQRRELNDGRLLFLTNSSIEHSLRGEFFVTGKDAVLLNTETGGIEPYPAKQSANGLMLGYDIPEAGSLLLFISDNTIKAEMQPTATSRKNSGTELGYSDLKIERLRPNVLTIDFCDLKLKDTVLRNQYFYYATDRLFKANGFSSGNPWNTSVQFNDNTIKRDSFSNGSGFSVNYYFRAAGISNSMQNLRALVERTELWDIAINGTSVKPITNEWWVDKDFHPIDIGRYIRDGLNTITLTAPRMSVYAEIEPIYILGDFDLLADTTAWKIIPQNKRLLGSWKKQGMPLYGHEISYSKTFTATAAKKRYHIEPGKWLGTVAILKVNGKEVKILMGNEKRCDISDYVQPGKNEVQLIVTGSLKNTFGPYYRNPKPGLVSPWHWRSVYKQLPGDKYDLYDYGLMEDFRIYTD